MSRDVFVIHSSEADTPWFLEDGWYVMTAYPDEDLTIENYASGPWHSHDEAIDAMREWMLS
jgi:hypothetical protein